nr:hypothetical protein [Mycoplasmopsis bovis]
MRLLSEMDRFHMAANVA